MTEPSPARGFIGRQRIPRSAAGLSLVELMIVVLIISLLFLTAVPAYQRIQRNARAASVVNDFRVFGAVFQSSAHEKGAWPAETSAGVLPATISGTEIQTVAWSRITPMGGRFDWEYNQTHPVGNGGAPMQVRAALTISSTSDAPLLIDADLLEKIDESLDDGNLETGNFRRGFGDCPLLIIEP